MKEPLVLIELYHDSGVLQPSVYDCGIKHADQVLASTDQIERLTLMSCNWLCFQPLKDAQHLV